MKDNKNTAQYLVDVLEKHDVEYVFGYPGEQVIPIYEALRQSNIKHVLMRHEQAAIHAADTYARITGNYGVCLSTAGPGAMNLVMGTSASFKDNVPVIVITGDVPSSDKGNDNFQDVDINSVFKPITIKSYYSNTPEKLENNVNEIFSYKNHGITGPFHINIPKDIQNEPMNMHHKVIESKIIKEPSQSNIQDTIKLINESEKPLIIIGSGIIYADAMNEIKTFIDKTKIPVATTYSARGIISEMDEKNLGLIGTRGTIKANYAARHADLILALGTRLTQRTTAHINTDNIIQVNTKKEHDNAKIFYQNNVKEFLKQLNKNKISQADNKWKNIINNQEDNATKTYQETTKLHPEKVVQTILRQVTDNTTITLDAGTSPTYFTIDSKLTKPSQMIFSGGLGPMGYSIPASIGAAFARPDDIIFAATSDGSIQMTIEELAVINTYQLPIIIFIINNDLLAIIKQWQDMAKIPPYQVKLNNPNFVEIAHAYNITAYNITSLKELEIKLKEAIKLRKPCLFNIDVEDIPIPLPK